MRPNLLIIFLLLSTFCYAQSSTQHNTYRGKLENDEVEDVNDAIIFEAVEQQAQFPGGTSNMYQFIADNLRYPATAMENNIQGNVTVRFVVRTDGSIGDVVIVRGVDKDLEQEAVRVVKSFPKFIPAKNNGIPVNSYFSLPIRFKLK